MRKLLISVIFIELILLIFTVEYHFGFSQEFITDIEENRNSNRHEYELGYIDYKLSSLENSEFGFEELNDLTGESFLFEIENKTKSLSILSQYWRIYLNNHGYEIY